MAETKRERYEVLRSQLELERSSFMTHWRELGEFILTRRPRFSVNDVNKGDRRNQKIIDSTGTLAARTLRSGMVGGITSPARPWFRLTVDDPDLADFYKAKRWLSTISDRMGTVFLRSNVYNSFPIVYGDTGVFSTAAMSVEEDFDDVIRTYPFPIGSYMIANDDKLKVNVFFRQFRLTVRQLILKFGKKTSSGAPDWSVFSDKIKSLWDEGHHEAWIDVCHVVQPNEQYDVRKLESKYKKFSSCYYERGMENGNSYDLKGVDRFLQESGYDYFPILCPRWEVTGEDVYGTSCPGMDALPDIKQLQLMQKRKAQGIEKMVNPAMVAPTSMRSTRTSILPGDVTYTDEREGLKGFRPAHEVNLDLSHLVEDIRDIRYTVKRAFFEDLFLMLSQSDRREITAREIEERHEEKLLALGPVLEQMNQDLLDPLIDITFMMMDRQGMIPPPPEELQGRRLNVQYLSVMAQAQKLVGISSIERFTSYIANYTANTKDMTMIRKFNAAKNLEDYADRLGINPSGIRSDDEVAEIAAAEQKQQQAMAAAEQMSAGAKAVKDLAGADMSGDNALTRIAAGAS